MAASDISINFNSYVGMREKLLDFFKYFRCYFLTVFLSMVVDRSNLVKPFIFKLTENISA